MNMAPQIVEIAVLAAAAYALIGVLFGLAFVTRGVQRIDDAATGASWRFRLIILPGVVALWPLLLSRWVRGRSTPIPERTAHTLAATDGASS